MFRPRKAIISLASEHSKKNIQIALTGHEISFITQPIQNLSFF
jgi:hypothetical protein